MSHHFKGILYLDKRIKVTLLTADKFTLHFFLHHAYIIVMNLNLDKRVKVTLLTTDQNKQYNTSDLPVPLDHGIFNLVLLLFFGQRDVYKTADMPLKPSLIKKKKLFVCLQG